MSHLCTRAGFRLARSSFEVVFLLSLSSRTILLYRVPACLVYFASRVLIFEYTARPVDTLIKQPSNMGNVQCDVNKAASSRYKQCLTALTSTPRFSLPTQPLESNICSLVSQYEFNWFPARGRRE